VPLVIIGRDEAIAMGRGLGDKVKEYRLPTARPPWSGPGGKLVYLGVSTMADVAPGSAR
jgi:hypothetical protein